VNPGRLGAARAVSYPFAGFIGFGAVAPVAVHWFPWQTGLPLAAVASVSFIVWIARRNRHTLSDSAKSLKVAPSRRFD
jgi:cyanate permease